MQYVDMKGTKVPALGFGTWQLNGNTCSTAVRKALDIGYRHIDTAQAYENEAEVGRAIAESGVARDELFVTTKIWMSNTSAKNVIKSTEESLKKLHMDYVDLLLLHWPTKVVPLAETLKAMAELRQAGKALAIGVSNFPVRLMRQAIEEIGADIACNQVEYHIALSQQPVLDYARLHGLIVTAYSPLGRGKLLEHPVLKHIGQRYDKTPGQVALRWLIEQPSVAAIPKAASEKNARQNFEIFDFKLDNKDLEAIAAISGTQRLINPSWAPEWDQAA